ncbi:MAG: amino acid transporter [Gammaproteobacteria bacterium RIFCSPHIGHO2_02_FULL_42_13]|nr:MAG: amino acid transporter [Gammaproteobacteria bacterium RIFCSPHIGHO2_02_FULL_42_13]OGT67550.1 MAG: amino acid transporter [Gammaproteobacteria bacterium RIFCSPLOWO2_02_FULL_42_9]
MIKKIKHLLFGAPRNPLSQDTRQHISLIALFAWIGLGADAVSSSAYGPEQTYLALGHYTSFALYIAIMVLLTVFIIALAYNQVIELFPSGGGGYKVASRLIGPYSGLISGVALLLGYVLTISISFASGIDALFSVLPDGLQHYKLITEILLIFAMMYINLRGMKESIKLLMPVFLGFVATHVAVIIYGVMLQRHHLTIATHQTVADTHHLLGSVGWIAMVAILLQSYSLGGGTYTGLEAVSNNVNNLAEPRVRTGKWAMFYIALSLGLIAGGIIFLYFLWDVGPVAGKTLNAVVFEKTLSALPYGHYFLILIMALETCVLFVGANTGFLGGPAVLANMAIDGWVPRRFRTLSSRLVVQNGIVLFGVAAVIIVLMTQGSVSELVILYSTSVFITFTLSLTGLCIYWAKNRTNWKWMVRLPLSIVGFLICASILVTIILSKFMEGGWLILFINGSFIALGIAISYHYKNIKKQVKKLDQLFTFPVATTQEFAPPIDTDLPTAVFFIGDSIGEGMHTVLWAHRMFSDYFKNFIFVSSGVVDVNSYESDKALEQLKRKVDKRLQYFVNYSKQHGIAATSLCSFGTDTVQKLIEMSEEIKIQFKLPIFFSARLVLKNETWFTRQLHNETPITLQRNLHLRGMQMIILPVMLGK